jgi:hypothetical protein
LHWAVAPVGSLLLVCAADGAAVRGAVAVRTGAGRDGTVAGCDGTVAGFIAGFIAGAAAGAAGALAGAAAVRAADFSARFSAFVSAFTAFASTFFSAEATLALGFAAAFLSTPPCPVHAPRPVVAVVVPSLQTVATP